MTDTGSDEYTCDETCDQPCPMTGTHTCPSDQATINRCGSC